TYLGPHIIHNMRRRQIPNLMRIPYRNIKARLRRLLHTHTRRRPRSHRWASRLHRRRHPRPPPNHLVVLVVVLVVVEPMRIRGPAPSTLLLLRQLLHSRPHNNLLLLLRRHGGRALASNPGSRIAVPRTATTEGPQRPEGIIDDFEARGLGDDAARRC